MTNKLLTEDDTTMDSSEFDSLTRDLERPSSYREALVGEGKKFKSDEDVARSAWEKDNVFIPKILDENKQLRKELQERANLEQLVNQLKNQSASNQQPTGGGERQDENPGHNNSNATAAPSKEEIAALVKSVVTEEKTQDARTRNIESCVSALKDLYGESYQSSVRARAKELNLTDDYLDNLAATSPKALLALLAPSQSKIDVRAPRSSVLSSPSSTRQSGGKDWAYYQDLRRKDPSRFYSAEVQLEIDRRARSGELEIPSS